MFCNAMYAVINAPYIFTFMIKMFIGLFIYSFNLQLCWLFVAVHGLSLIVGKWGATLLAVCGLLIEIASLAADHVL